jgi:diguanylate cyclase (GGDEF)-like protein
MSALSKARPAKTTRPRDIDVARMLLEELGHEGDITTTAQALQHIRMLVRDLKEQKAIAEALAVTDGLTGLANKRHFSQRLEERVNEARRGQPLSVVLVDLDHFKSYNDVYGHQEGDALLVLVAQAIRDSIRVTDLAARWGGEEFAVILTGTPHDGAKVVAEKIRQAIAALPAHRKVSASVGICSWEEGLDAPKLVHRADQALYGAKRTGRNRVRSATEPGILGDEGFK